MIGIIETMQIVNKQITEIARGVLILFQDPPAARIVAKAADQKVTWAFSNTQSISVWVRRQAQGSWDKAACI